MNKILVIDSANIFSPYIEFAADRYGYCTRSAGSAGEALRMLKSEPFDLIITQDEFPDMSWPDFCREAASGKARIDLPLIVLSPEPGSFDESRSGGLTVEKVRSRPVSMKDLFAVIQKHLPHRNRRRGIRASLAVKALLRDGDQQLPCQVLNLSEGGVFIMKKEPLPIGSEVRLVLPFEGEKTPLEVRGRVVYVVQTARGRHPRGMGIQFNDMEESLREKLNRHVDDYVSDILGR